MDLDLSSLPPLLSRTLKAILSRGLPLSPELPAPDSWGLAAPALPLRAAHMASQCSL